MDAHAGLCVVIAALDVKHRLKSDGIAALGSKGSLCYLHIIGIAFLGKVADHDTHIAEVALARHSGIGEYLVDGILNSDRTVLGDAEPFALVPLPLIAHVEAHGADAVISVGLGINCVVKALGGCADSKCRSCDDCRCHAGK